VADESWGSGLRDADLLIWVGDFNYRIDPPPGFELEPETPENTRNDQLYSFVHGKVGCGSCFLIGVVASGVF